MITVGQEQHLGRKTFLLFLSRRTTSAMILFLVAIVLFALGPSLSLGVAGALSLGGPINAGAVSTSSALILDAALLAFFLGVLAFALGFIVSYLQYRNYVFSFDEFGVKVRRGILSQKEISIPYRQIQDVDIIRTIVHRCFGVSKLVMITAGHEDKGEESDGTDTVLDPIDRSIGEEMRTFLERRIGVQIVEGEAQADKEEQTEEHQSLSS